MIKILLLNLILLTTLSLVNCGGGASTPTDPPVSSPPSQSQTDPNQSGNSDNSVRPQSQVPEDVLVNGKYEGEFDSNEKFTGWGVWVYYRDEINKEYTYEGYWEYGMPNGDGTLYIRYGGLEVVTRGKFVNGFAHGPISLTINEIDYEIPISNAWNLELDMGQVVDIGIVISDSIEKMEFNTAGYGGGTFDYGSVPPWRWYPASISP
ncbi:MAG: hypothetical protein FWD44_01480 [Oscillospiraceae bacterium]|nr:hypothetical protein [Oscillospiraceae bacterium]